MVRRIIRSVQLAVTACAVIGLFIVSGQTPLLAQETAVRRTTLLVEDIGRSIDFYQRLGLTPWYEKSTSDTDEGGVIGALDLPL
ncbi:MAG: hypothetical protein HOA00_07375, partial [Rhodospirillaceae bacterium]|nr:hypothetical protein [Rhodospirillaceae bacterium]